MRLLQSYLLLTATLLFLLSCTGEQNGARDSAKQKSETPKKVWTIPLTHATDGMQRHLTGTIQAADAVSISFEVSGVISKMHVDLGQSFTQGDILAELDTRVYELAVQKSQSNLGEAKAALVNAKQIYERNSKLKKQGLLSQASLDDAVANFDIAKQRLDVAKSALGIAKKNLADTQLIAPYSGRVSARLVEPSQQIQAGTEVLSIQGNANLEVNAAIPEGLIGKVNLFDAVDVVVPSLSTSYTYAATLTEIGAQASIANAFPITITFDHQHTGFYPGMSAEIILSVGSLYDNDDYFKVPFSAFTTDKSGPYLYVVEAQQSSNEYDDKMIAKKHYIDIVELSHDAAIIRFKNPSRKMLATDLRIVKTGVDFLRPDQAISVVENSTQIYNH